MVEGVSETRLSFTPPTANKRSLERLMAVTTAQNEWLTPVVCGGGTTLWHAERRHRAKRRIVVGFLAEKPPHTWSRHRHSRDGLAHWPRLWPRFPALAGWRRSSLKGVRHHNHHPLAIAAASEIVDRHRQGGNASAGRAMLQADDERVREAPGSLLPPRQSRPSFSVSTPP